MTRPNRPRLNDQVVVRRHLGEGDTVVLHDETSRRVSRILPVQWQVLALADGTRDTEAMFGSAGPSSAAAGPAS